MNPRLSWNDLPAGLRGRIEAAGGSFVRAEQLGAGHNCLVGMILHTTAGIWFLKGVPADHARSVWTQSNEAAINAHVRPVTAPLAFRVQAEGWDVLGFECLTGYRHADLAPGSPDLPDIAAALHALSVLPPPEDISLRRIEDRWRDYAGDHVILLAGSAIAHTGYRLPRPAADPRRARSWRRRALVPGAPGLCGSQRRSRFGIRGRGAPDVA